MVVVEDDNNIYFEFYFKIWGDQRRAGEEAWEDHVKRNVDSSADVSFSNLDVLDLCRWKI